MMQVFGTYCSYSKASNVGLIPAIHRYQSSRIQKVFSSANLLNLDFFILSGEYGLIHYLHPIPWYDHLLIPTKVGSLIDLVACQIKEYGIMRLVYFTKHLMNSKSILPYHDTIVAACSRESVPVFIIELEEEEDMADWREIMGQAEAARIRMIENQADGERLFQMLLSKYPRDGMVYFKRGEAYAFLCEKEKATDDFEKAIALFPMEAWKARAKAALEKFKEC